MMEKLRFLLGLLCLAALGAQAQTGQDYTRKVAGAACDDAEFWYVEGVSSSYDSNGRLQYVVPNSDGGTAVLHCDTWSGRGGSDGSQMTTPFMEYWENKSNNTGAGGAHLPAAEIRHQTVTGLPAGQYRVTMRVRCYAETWKGYVEPAGVKLYANGVRSDDVCTGELSYYSGGAHYTNAAASVTCTVGTDGELDFGLSVTSDAYSTELSWVAWKDVKLTYLGDGTLMSGTYYLRNREADAYLEAGAKYGTQGVLGSYGTLLTATKMSGTTYSIGTEFNYYGKCYMEANGDDCTWLDATQTIWTIEKNGEGYFTLQSDYGYLGDDYNYNNVLSVMLTNPDAFEAQWEFVSKADRVQRLLDGKETDATFLIGDAHFDRNFADTPWMGSFDKGGIDDYGYGNQNAEVWGGNASTIDVSQRLTNIPNGRYRLSAQGFYRWNDNGKNSNARALEVYEDGTYGDYLYAQLFAKSGGTEKTSLLPSIASELDYYESNTWITNVESGLPYSQYAGSWAFVDGYYPIPPITIDVTDHQLTVGIRKSQQDGCDWTLWDNFELTLLSLGDNEGWAYDAGAQYDDIPFGEATPDNPVDCTELISDKFYTFRSYGGTGVANKTFNDYKLLEGLPNGIYRLKAQGLYRYGDVQKEEHDGYGGDNENYYNNVWATYTIPYAILTHRYGTERLLATLYGNSFSAPLPSIFDGAHDVETHSGDFDTEEFGWVPNTTGAAAEAFDEGDYQVELLVPVTDGTLLVGVKKELGYKYDWTCYDNVQLEYLGDTQLTYATGIKTDVETLSLTPYEQRQVNASVLPATASNTRLSMWADNDCISVDANGVVTANSTGTATLYISAEGSDGYSVSKAIPVTVSGSVTGDVTKLVINEIQVSNLDMYLDPSNNYGGYIELYNPTTASTALAYPQLSDGKGNQCQLASIVTVPAKGFATIYFDHNSGESGNYGGNVPFKLDMDGGIITLTDRYGNAITSQTYPAATARTSYARTTDGGGTWGTTAYPTPGASNSQSKEILTGTPQRVEAPVATPGTGFYTLGDLLPAIKGEGTIYCTTDGSVPSETNGVTPDKLTAFKQTTVLRMRAYAKGKLPSEVVTCTYTADQYHHTLPVLMVTADPKDIYSDELGIFVTGTNGATGSGIEYPCNWNRDWDRAANMQLLDAEGNSLFQQDVNLSRFGGWSRSWIPYNFKLKAQKQHEGKNYLEYPFFQDNKPYLKHKVLQVRNGGNDVFCRIKDASLHHIIISSGFYLDCLDYQPVHCYINGQYYGMQNLREPSNKHYALADYGIDTDELDAMELTWGVTVKAGNASAFWDWYSLAQSAYDDDTYEEICNLVDVDEFANYMAAQLYLGGDDWPGNNCKGFKGNDGKFHVVFFDVDQALRFDRGAFTRLYRNNTSLISIFRNMLYNDTFRKKFIDSFCLFGGSVMNPERCADIIDRIAAEMDPALALEGLSTQPTAGYMKQVLTTSRQETMLTALENFIGSDYASDFSSTRAYKVKLAANIDAAQLQVNGIAVPTQRFDGTLYAPTVLTASAPEGYTFKGWRSSGGTWLSRKETFDLSALSSSEALTETLEMEAVYEAVANDAARLEQIAMPIKVNEVSADNTIFASETWKRSDWIELYNTTDTPLDVEGLFVSDDIDQPLKYQIKKPSAVCNTVIPAGGHLMVWADGLGSNPTQRQLHTTFKLANSDGEQVIVVSGDDFVANNAAYFEAHPDMRTFIDGLTYVAHRGDETVGRFPDGGKAFYKMTRPTPERSNTLLPGDEKTGDDESLMSLLPDGFTLELAEGWNWASHCLFTPIDPATLPQNAERVLSQTREAYRQGAKMVGTLKQMEAGALYKVQMKAADTFYSSKQLCDSSMPIGLLPGWNWVGYPVSGSQTVAKALSGYLADEGDRLVGQDGFATYSGGAWTGSLTTLETGKGYMLYTQQAKSLSFSSPSVTVNPSKARAQRRAAVNRYGVNKHAYPNVMGIVGTLLQGDDTPADADRFTLLAYADGECRGVGAWVGGQLYLTAYGQGGETLQFFAFDEGEGMAYPVVEEHVFEADVKGTPLSPVRFHLGESEATDLAAVAAGGAPHVTVEGYYSLSGLRVGGIGASLAPGIYIVKYQDGSFRKTYIR